MSSIFGNKPESDPDPDSDLNPTLIPITLHYPSLPITSGGVPAFSVGAEGGKDDALVDISVGSDDDDAAGGNHAAAGAQRPRPDNSAGADPAGAGRDVRQAIAKLLHLLAAAARAGKARITPRRTHRATTDGLWSGSGSGKIVIATTRTK